MHRPLLIVLPFFCLLLELVFSLTSYTTWPQEVTLTLFMAGWMLLWWIFEVMPLGVTALIPIVYLPLTNILDLKSATAPYANPVIYLFLGGFVIARALEKTDLSRRIALMTLKVTGSSDKGVIVGFMIATTAMSMWISNTATTVMMVPIALSVMSFLKTSLNKDQSQGLEKMSVCLFLSIAYCANIGGVMTPVGTPPNVVLLGFLKDIYNLDIDFWKWMLLSAPMALGLLFIQGFLLMRIFPFQVSIGKEFQNFVREKLMDLGALDSKQKVTITIFALTASLWVFKDLIHWLLGQDVFNDTSIAILGGLLMFLIPTSKTGKEPVLDQKDLSYLPWNIVLLFGGGMSMATALKEVGVLEMSTTYLSSFQISSAYLLTFILAASALFLTEVMSNVALCVVALPIMMSLGVEMGLTPILIGMPVAFCSSFAFSMPISTPPNAIVFGTGQVPVKSMLKAGMLLNLLSLFLVMSLGWFMLRWFL